MLLMGAGMVTFGGLWMSESMDNVQLSGDLALARDELAAAESTVQGLKKRNRLLQLQLQQLPLLEFQEDIEAESAGRSRRLPSTDMGEDPEEETISAAADGAGERDRESSDSSEPERTPEEEAERAARWAEREQRRQESRLQMAGDLQDRREFFSQIPLEGLTPEYAEANVRLIEAMGEMQVMLAEMSQEGLSRDDRREIWGRLRENSREVRRLMDTQKEVLLYDYAEVELGLDAEKKQEFLDYMNTIEAYTTMPWRSRRGR